MAFKLNLNALKNPNWWKELVLQQGEKIALITAIVVAAIMLLAGLLLPLGPGYGGLWVMTSPSANASVLNKDAEDVEKGLNDNRPPPPDRQPPEKQKLPEMRSYAVENPDKFLVKELFVRQTPADSSRRQPDVLAADEGRVEVVMGQVLSHVFDPTFQKVMVLRGAGKGAGAQQMQGLAGPAGRRQGMGGGRGMQMPGPGPNAEGRFGRSAQIGQGPEDRKDYSADWVILTELDDAKLADGKLATTVRPLRMALIAASFPFKAQLDEFRNKLRLPNYQAVLGEQSQMQDEEGQALPSFRFLGVKVERRAVDAQGNPIPLAGKPANGWEPVDLEKDYKYYLFLNGKQFQPEDPKLEAFTSIEGLMMPRLMEARPREAGHSMYPPVETELTNIRKTLDELEKAAAAKAPPPLLPQQFNTDKVSIFNKGGNQANAQGPMAPGAGPVPPGPRTARGEQRNMARPPGPGGPMGPNDPGLEESIPPTHCPVRIIDVTVRPGTIYEYRLKVVMANPNYKRTDVASPQYAEEKELESDKWFVIPQKVIVPPENAYYAVDQRDIDGPKSYTGLNYKLALDKTRQIAFQLHRWLETGTGDYSRTLIGEWAVAERILVNRGEYIGRVAKVEVPVWRDTLDDYIIPETRVGNRKESGIDILFSDPRNEAILVDFEPGDQEYKRPAGATVRETGASGEKMTTEVMILSPEGKLLVHDSKSDEEDAKRKERLNEWRARVKEVKEKKPAGGQRQPGAPFGRTPGG